MYYFLSKVFLFFINPLCWVIFLVIYIFRTTSPKRKKIAFFSTMFILLFMTNEIILNEVLLKWEIEYTRVDQLEKTYDYGLVLTGNQYRYNSAISMFRKGKIKNICILGRHSNTNLKDQLIEVGIPEEVLFFESNSRNTYEHSLFFKDFMDEIQPKALDTSSFILITSAFHLRRSKMCFDKQKIPTALYGHNSRSYERKYYRPTDMIPTAQAMFEWEKIIREWVGIITYKVLGYV